MNKDIWKNEKNFDNWELRQHRFASEMLPVIMSYLRIKPQFDFLDMGCGTGVFTRYLAKGLTHGKAYGIDISPNLVNFAKKKVIDLGIQQKINYEIADAYELPYDDERFDVVTGHTFLGVVDNTENALREMIRVCKTGGSVSAIEVVGGNEFIGNYRFENNERLNELYRKQESIYTEHIRKSSIDEIKEGKWSVSKFPLLFRQCDLKNISINSFSYAFSYSDPRWDINYKLEYADKGIKNIIRWVEERKELFHKYKLEMTSAEFDELLLLLEKKREYLIENIDTEQSWEWMAGLCIIIVGDK